MPAPVRTALAQVNALAQLERSAAQMQKSGGRISEQEALQLLSESQADVASLRQLLSSKSFTPKAAAVLTAKVDLLERLMTEADLRAKGGLGIVDATALKDLAQGDTLLLALLVDRYRFTAKGLETLLGRAQPLPAATDSTFVDKAPPQVLPADGPPELAAAALSRIGDAFRLGIASATRPAEPSVPDETLSDVALADARAAQRREQLRATLAGLFDVFKAAPDIIEGISRGDPAVVNEVIRLGVPLQASLWKTAVNDSVHLVQHPREHIGELLSGAYLEDFRAVIKELRENVEPDEWKEPLLRLTQLLLDWGKRALEAKGQAGAVQPSSG